MDEDASEFLTRKVFPAIKEELIRLEIIEEDTELLGHTFYVATQGCSTFQLIFLDQRIASVVQSKLEEYGFYLRKDSCVPTPTFTAPSSQLKRSVD